MKILTVSRIIDRNDQREVASDRYKLVVLLSDNIVNSNESFKFCNHKYSLDAFSALNKTYFNLEELDRVIEKSEHCSQIQELLYGSYVFKEQGYYINIGNLWDDEDPILFCVEN